MTHHLMGRHLSPPASALGMQGSQSLPNFRGVTRVRERLHAESAAEKEAIAACLAKSKQ